MSTMHQMREQMLQLLASEIGDGRVLAAMAQVPRERFVPPARHADAYADRALPLGDGQTISQPLIVAEMLEAIRPQPNHRVLEIGTGSGYVAALLAELCREVVTIERHPGLAASSRDRLAELGYGNIRVIGDNGSLGWPDAGPYDGIMVSAAGPAVPDALRQQLAVGGCLVIPVGRSSVDQELVCITRRGEQQFERRELGRVMFVPVAGRSEINADYLHAEPPHLSGGGRAPPIDCRTKLAGIMAQVRHAAGFGRGDFALYVIGQANELQGPGMRGLSAEHPFEDRVARERKVERIADAAGIEERAALEIDGIGAVNVPIADNVGIGA